MKIVIENVSDGENIPHNILLIRGRVDNLDSSLLEGKLIMFLKVYKKNIYMMSKNCSNTILSSLAFVKKNYIISMPEVVM